MLPLTLFPDPEADARDEHHRRAVERAQRQSRCPACGCFARYPQDFAYDSVCLRCVDDQRPAIKAKVAIIERWWKARNAAGDDALEARRIGG